MSEAEAEMEQAAQDAAAGAYAEAEDRDFGTSVEDIAAYAQVAGAIAGAAACSAVGAAPLAPLCAWVVGELAGWMTETAMRRPAMTVGAITRSAPACRSFGPDSGSLARATT